jgi:LuxR family maltose regulon positive regulatory protein
MPNDVTNGAQPTDLIDADDLLRTKHAPPRLRAALLPRAALLARLDAGLEQKLTLVSAPAGYGKTTLVANWIQGSGVRDQGSEIRYQGAVETFSNPRPLTPAPSPQPLAPTAAWVSLDDGDNDPVRFWRYIISACRTFGAAIGSNAPALLHVAPRPDFDAMLTALINDLAQLPDGAILVLEDYHVITSDQIQSQITFLIDHLPPTLRLVLITRSDPPLPLARLRAQGALNELRAADLRFSHAEIRDFFEHALPFALAPEAVARLDAQTEGWAAGLRLIALALHGSHAPDHVDQVLASFTGNHQHIVAYLVAEVLGAQPEPLQTFLLQTSVLSRLTGDLCNAVAGRNDSAPVLEALDQANLFLEPLDGTRQWYRYHALFAEAMQHEARRRFGEEQTRALHERACEWYAQHGLLDDAVESALAAHAFARAATLIDTVLEPSGITEEVYTLRRWLEHLPEATLHTSPTLCFAYATALLFTEDRRDPATLARLQAPLQVAEQRWREAGDQPRLGTALAFRGMAAWWQSDLPQTFIASRQALALLPEHDVFWRGVCLLGMSLEQLFTGAINAARSTALEARAVCQAAGNEYGVRAALLTLGEVYVAQAYLGQAQHLYEHVLATAGDDRFDQALALIGLAKLAYEWNDLAFAERRIAEAQAIGNQIVDQMGRQLVEDALLIPAALLLANVQHARGELEQARQTLHDLSGQTLRRGWDRLHRSVLAAQARLALADGNLAAAQRRLTACAQHSVDLTQQQREQEALIAARLQIAQGDPESALRALEHWQADAHAQGRTRSELEMLIVIALARRQMNALPQACDALLQALTAAQPEGLLRVFLDEDPPIVELLALISAREPQNRPLRNYIEQLLAEFNVEQAARDEQLAACTQAPNPQFPGPSLLEPLSPQERRILRLLAAGLSYPEIAQELIVSVNTIKTHVKHIYRKLDVTSRRDARNVARQLKLI